MRDDTRHARPRKWKINGPRTVDWYFARSQTRLQNARSIIPPSFYAADNATRIVFQTCLCLRGVSMRARSLSRSLVLSRFINAECGDCISRARPTAERPLCNLRYGVSAKYLAHQARTTPYNTAAIWHSIRGIHQSVYMPRHSLRFNASTLETESSVAAAAVHPPPGEGHWMADRG